MPLNPRLFQTRLDAVRASGAQAELRDIRIGLEREALRVDAEANLSRRPHPRELGAALTHPYITTDYSEAMIELITPPGRLDETHAFLAELHRYAHGHLDGENLWCGSMPCVIAGDPDIPLARYGESSAGRMKTIYRRGLGYRYTRSMQVIAGLHFNCSMPDGFWRHEQGGAPDRAAVSERYFDVLRNLLRLGWLVAYLWGASPATCRRFLARNPSDYDLESFTPGTYYGPHATSLRLGGIGYQNNLGASTGVHADYNSLASYTRSLRQATSTPCPAYERIGVRQTGKYLQLNANRLQIENEFYSAVRPKCVPHGNERPTRGLRLRGVEYVELRALDVNPFEPCGIDLAAMRLLTALIVYCLLDDSPGMSEAEQQEAHGNMQRVAQRGRDAGVMLQRGGAAVGLRDWAEELLADLQPVCALLDEAYGHGHFVQAWEQQQERVRDVAQTLSAQMVADMRERGEGYVEWVLARSQAHRRFFMGQPPDAALSEQLDQMAVQSHAQQQAMEAAEREAPVPFEDYLAAYEAQR